MSCRSGAGGFSSSTMWMQRTFLSSGVNRTDVPEEPMGWPHRGRAVRMCEGPRGQVRSSKGRPVGLMRQCLPGGSYTCSPHITFQTPAGAAFSSRELQGSRRTRIP